MTSAIAAPVPLGSAVPPRHRPGSGCGALTVPAVVLAVLLALAGALPAIEPTATPVARDGTRAIVDLPAAQHMRNTGGMGRRGPGTGAGLCVFTSCEIASRWQNGPLGGFQKWMTPRPGGGDPKKLQAMITQFCREKGLKEPDYVQHTGGDVAFLETAMKTGRIVCVTYAGMDDFYGGGVDHMVCLAHLDAQRAAIIDNNRPGVWVWMTRAEFELRWRARGGGWAVVFLSPPPPPPPAELKSWIVVRSLRVPFSSWRLRYREALTESEFMREWVAGESNPPRFHAQPVSRFTDRSGSSVYVERDIGNGRSECGTGTVIAAAPGKSLVLTNAHVAGDGTRPLTVTVAGRPYPAKYVAGSRVTHTGPDQIAVDGPDLALLSVPESLPAVPLADGRPTAGVPVCIWGYGRLTDGGPTFKAGQTLAQGNYVGEIQLTTIASQNGDSGSGVFDAQGQLVAVGWGGRDGTQFAVRLDAVKAFLAPHLKGFAAPVGAAAGPADGDENHGINRDELDRHTRDGKRTYWINGREVGRPQALDAVAAGGLGLVDDSDHYHLSIVTADPVAARAALADPRLATALGRVHVQVYAPTDWAALERRLKAAVTLQEPALKGGKVVWTAETVDIAALLDGLKRADPNYRPDPPAPKMPDPVLPPAPAAPKQPDADLPADAPPPPPPPQPSNALLYLIAAVVVAIVLAQRKGS